MSLLSPFHLALAELPLDVDDNQVIYIENEYDHDIDFYVRWHLKEIKDVFTREGLEFIYLPECVELEHLPELERKAKYMMPWITQEDAFKLIELRHIRTRDIFGPQDCGGAHSGIIWFDGHEYRGYKIKLEKGLERVLFQQIAEAYGKIIRRRSYCIEECSYSLSDEEYISPEIRFLLEKIKQLNPSQIERELILKALDDTRVISTLHITKRYDIILPEYSDMRIHLTPLQKALYFLFLKHPEGISTYDMPNYRDELLNIYNSVTRRDNIEKNIASIDKIVDRLDNARNEHISKIRYAFISQFSEELAREYLIVRNTDGIMKINLSPDKIIWE